uniref:acyl-coenzyme A thioesterase THEM4-like n=1 Tax=Euleptes europaea TaxID=460621 RepID=UPI0025419317|nr:acyl-coenzyme A thioesterase THEM4-like [Euleptes europaea]
MEDTRCPKEASTTHDKPKSCGHQAKGLDHWRTLRCGPWVAARKGVVLRPAHLPFSNITVCLCQSRRLKDYALPNASWSKEMLDQFNKFMEMCKDGTWIRIPSYRNVKYDIAEWQGEKLEDEEEETEARLFSRSVDVEGLGFEYVMFCNLSEKRVVCLFQPGPYLEGPPGFVHGGSVATVLDNNLMGCAFMTVGGALMANLNISFKSPIPLGSVVLVESRVEKVEGRKMFTSGLVRSTDGETIYAKATALVILMESKKSHL